MNRLLIDATELVQLDNPDTVLCVDDSMTNLEQQDPRLARIVKLCFWTGLSEASRPSCWS
ncbi:MAG: hypothetical protein ACI841_003029 [Planctomycetota bacterium]|jgi:hypothetical protein